MELSRQLSFYDALRAISQFMDIHSRALYKSTGVTGPQLSVLLALSNESPLLVTEISRRVHLSIGTISGTIFRLEEKGLIERARSLEDRRKALLSLTPRGEALLAAAPSPLPDNFVRNFENGLPEWEKEMILSSLLRLTTLMAQNGQPDE